MDDTDTPPWETLATTRRLSTRDFDVFEDRVRLPDGTETTVTHLREPPAVVILPFTPDGSVVLVAEWRHAVGRTSHGLPAGSIEDAESITDAAHRELAEETGYDASDVEVVQTVEPANGVSDARHHHVLARDCTPTASQDLDADETISVDTRDWEELVAAVRAGDIVDGRTVLGVALHAFRNP
ncbi:MAG: NUDIX hydrolase [Halobacteriaceae archaeon]